MAMAKTGIAGNHGERVRSDCRINLKINSTGGINLTINSRVGALYGNSIRELLLQILKHYAIDHADIIVDDSGALDFVIAARLEAAIKQIQDTDVEFLLPSRLDKQTPSDPDRFRMTRLYLPGNTPAMMINAGLHEPDGIILDLEDSVAQDRKGEARILVRNSLRNLDFYSAEKMIRINPFPEGILDLDYIIPQGPDLILIPKVEHPDHIKAVESRINDLISSRGISRKVFLMPILESALGIENAFKIACSSGNIVAMTIGLEDYTADLGVARTEKGTESLYARSRLVNACRAAGIQAIDSVYSDVANEQGLRKTVQRSCAMGFEGMGCIHPRQISVISKTYQPSNDQIVKARQIILAFEQAKKDGLGVVSLGSKMIDPPVVKRAEKTIELALKMGLLNKDWRKENE